MCSSLDPALVPRIDRLEGGAQEVPEFCARLARVRYRFNAAGGNDVLERFRGCDVRPIHPRKDATSYIGSILPVLDHPVDDLGDEESWKEFVVVLEVPAEEWRQQRFNANELQKLLL